MKELADEELLRQYRRLAGTPEANRFVEELFGRHYSKVAAWCFRLVGNQDRAADLAQEVMTKAWAHLDHFEGKAKFSTWLYTIARNHCFNTLKSAAWRREESAGPEQLESFASAVADPEEAAETAERTAWAQQTMAQELTDVERQVMTLHFAEELPLDAISRLLRLDNASGAKAFVVSAKRKLRSSVERLTRRRKGASGNEGSGYGR
ncbi:MAG: sigma-70 family RNA polymerase sigma factor [Bryobacterales bacterium]|nr:sigma-70 family RNA polymerase sigma factor [Bryobacterales bacterium]